MKSYDSHPFQNHINQLHQSYNMMVRMIIPLNHMLQDVTMNPNNEIDAFMKQETCIYKFDKQFVLTYIAVYKHP